MHTEALAYIKGHTKGNRYPHVLEFGSLNINGSVRAVIDSGEHWGIDVQDGPGVNQVADAVGYLYDFEADLVVCCEVLEHAADIPGIVRSAFENLRPGGVFLVTCATDPRAPHSAVDGGTLRVEEWYKNVDPQTLIETCEGAGFIVQDHQVADSRGDLYLRAKKP